MWCAASAIRSGVVALLLVVAAGCADPDFTSNAEDGRRLDALKADAIYSYLTGRTSCDEALARYVPSNGLPLDFAGIEANRITCHVPNGRTAELIVVAEAAAWTPSIASSTFKFRKKFGDVWASMTLETGGDDLAVVLAAPDHTRKGRAPGSSEIVEGRACVDAVRLKAPPTPSCSLSR